jgi:hypothetical protein
MLSIMHGIIAGDVIPLSKDQNIIPKQFRNQVDAVDYKRGVPGEIRNRPDIDL